MTNPLQVLSDMPWSEIDPKKDFFRHRKDCDYLAIESRRCIYRMGDGARAYGPLSKKHFVQIIKRLEKPSRRCKASRVKVIAGGQNDSAITATNV